MGHFLRAIKNNIIVNGKPQISGILYLLSMPIGLMACYSSITLGLKLLKTPNHFHMANVWIALLSALVFGLKIPYVVDKPIALISFALNCIGWGIATIIMLLALKKHEKYEKDKKDKKDKDDKQDTMVNTF